MRALLIVLMLFAAGCDHLQNLAQVQETVGSDSELTQLYTSTRQRYVSSYALPEFNNNVPAFRQTSRIKFSDNTVYMGSFLAWQAYLARTPAETTAALPKIQASFDHLLNDLVVPTVLPGTSTQNTGYFVRDDVTETSLTLAGQTYAVASDAQNGTDNDMSQDQMIHVLFGYTALAETLAGRTDAGSTALLTRIKAHADNIGLRLKAYGYMIVTPSGAQAKRGADARAFAWPLAATVARLTGQPESRYLTGLSFGKDAKGKEIALSAGDLKDLYLSALDGLEAGICDIQVGKDKHYLCNRFTLALINCLYYSSGAYTQRPLYLDRIEDDGDLLRGFVVRRALGQKFPKIYADALHSALTGAFSDITAHTLWCSQNRWIFMPASCPESGSDPADPQLFNALDFLALYDAVRAPAKGPGAPAGQL